MRSMREAAEDAFDPLAAAVRGGSGRARRITQKVKTDRAITAFLVGLKSRGAALSMQRLVNEYSGEPLTAILPGATLLEVWEIVGAAEKTLFAVSVLVVVVGLAGMLVALLTSLSERRREMAVLRSVGARPIHVFGLILGEAAFLTLLGIALGIAALYLGLLIGQPWLESAPWTVHRDRLAIGLRIRTDDRGGRGRRAHRPDPRVPHLPLFARRRNDHTNLTP